MKLLLNIFKATAICIAVCLALFAVLVVYALFIEPLPNKAERHLLQRIEAHLQKPGDWALVSDIQPGDWKEVCLIPPMSLGGGQDERSIRKSFQITTETLNLPNGVPSSTDQTWSVLFFYPPNTVEGFELPSKPIVGGGVTFIKEQWRPCRDRDRAVFVATDPSEWTHKPQFGIRLTTLQQIQQPQGEDE